jgi:hypothetical protein
MVAVRKDLSSLAGLGIFPNREPSHEWLGYFQGTLRLLAPLRQCSANFSGIWILNGFKDL